MCCTRSMVWGGMVLVGLTASGAELPKPILSTLFPGGAQVGQEVQVAFTGSGLDEVRAVHCSLSGLTFELDPSAKQQHFKVKVPPETPLGVYDLRLVCRNGISSPRPFVIGNRQELVEATGEEPIEDVRLDVTINGRIEKKGDVDQFRFQAKQGQRVVIECWAERIDSPLRGILEVHDASGKRLASNRGYFGIDPLIHFHVPSDGQYTVKLYDLVFAGGGDYTYRLDIDTGPRIAFTVPAVVEQGKRAKVMVHGWNLGDAGADASGMSQVAVEIPADVAQPKWPLRATLQPAQTCLQGFPFYLPGAHGPVLIGLTDVPLVQADSKQGSASSALAIPIPCEVSGQLVAGSQQHWFAITGRRGEVLYLEGLAHRIRSPLDMDVRIFDSTGQQELAHFEDELRNLGGVPFPTNHLDPEGRWVVPRDGRFLILVRNATGGADDPRRVYRMSVRREEPDFSVAAIEHSGSSRGGNVSRGGRTVFDIIALRRRGLRSAIRVSARNLPPGIQCPDVWLGPNVDRTTLVVSAERNAHPFAGALQLEATTANSEAREVRSGVVVRSSRPNGWSRLTSEIGMSVAGTADIRLTANGHETRNHHLYGELKVRHAPGGILDVAVQVERSDRGHQAPVNLIGVGVPDAIPNQTATIPPGAEKGYISFYLPRNLPLGRYSLALRGETTVLNAQGKPQKVTLFSNVVSFDVERPAFFIKVDPYAPSQIKRGEVVQVNYSVRRLNGFISKIHTELATPDKVTEVPGLRGRGVTSVGQSEKGTIQIIANTDAPLGQLPFLRLYAVGTVEDEAVFHGSCFLQLKVVD